MRNRAVVLAQLLALADRRLGCRGGVPIAGQRLGQGSHSIGRVDATQRYPVALFEFADALPSELLDHLLPAGVDEEAQCMGGEIVVGVLEGVTPLGGQCEDLGRSATTTMSVDPLFTGLDDTAGHEGVEVSSDRCRCRPEPL